MTRTQTPDPPVSYDYQALDPVLHSRIRLAVVAALAPVESADFSFLCEQVGTTGGNLGSHMKRLTASGYVSEHKGAADGRPRTTYRLTEAGRNALRDYVAHLERLLP